MPVALYSCEVCRILNRLQMCRPLSMYTLLSLSFRLLCLLLILLLLSCKVSSLEEMRVYIWRYGKANDEIFWSRLTLIIKCPAMWKSLSVACVWHTPSLRLTLSLHFEVWRWWTRIWFKITSWSVICFSGKMLSLWFHTCSFFQIIDMVWSHLLNTFSYFHEHADTCHTHKGLERCIWVSTVIVPGGRFGGFLFPYFCSWVFFAFSIIQKNLKLFWNKRGVMVRTWKSEDS